MGGLILVAVVLLSMAAAVSVSGLLIHGLLNRVQSGILNVVPAAEDAATLMLPVVRPASPIRDSRAARLVRSAQPDLVMTDKLAGMSPLAA